MHTRDIIAIGASMGGVGALSALVGQLPADLPASVLVVQHRSAEPPELLSEILSHRGPLPAVAARDHMALEHGRIYVAPPDRHLLVTEGGLRVNYGPRENRARPAIDVLFRTAAVHRRSRVIGVVLTGLLGDGAAGLLAIHRCGGVAVVQALTDASYPEMPARALAAVPTAEQVPLAELGSMLARLAYEAAPQPPPVPEALRIEARLTESATATDDWGNVPSRVEEALWIALQRLQEQAQVLESLASDDRRRGWDRNATGYEERAREARAAANRLRDLVTALAA